MIDFNARFESYIHIIDTALDEQLAVHQLRQQAVVDAMRYSLTAGGKRLRPMLTLEFCRALGGDPAKAIPFACAVEMVHCYSLIHDDLPCMDDDALRRGQPSCHIRFGEANALLAGDALLTYAFQLIALAPQTHGVSPAAALDAVAILSERAGFLGMIGGQTIDLAYENRSMDADTLAELHRMKTGALIEASCRLGAAAAEADTSVLDQVSAYGYALGLAFQIIDDILDVTGDASALGKPTGSDRENGKTTYVTLYGLDEAKKLAADLTQAAIKSLSCIPDHAFLMELTQRLLARSH